MKNIILIITDTFRYDNLGDMAKRPVRTPALDAFKASRAASIERFQAASFPTIPHRTDMATGRLGWPRYSWQPIDMSSSNHIAKLLRDADYATQLICDCPHLFNARFQQAFHAAFQHRGQEADVPLLHLNDPIEKVVPDAKTRPTPRFFGASPANTHRWTNRAPRCEEEFFMARTGSTAIRWLEENYKANPFFLWLDLFDPHEPWDAPEYLVRHYDPDYQGPPMTHCNYGHANSYTPEELHNLWAHYAAETELVDRWIGRVLQKIDDLDLWKDSVVAVTSDHGTSLGEHDRAGKSNINDADPRFSPIYPEVNRVPFLIAGEDIPAGASLDFIAQPQDILPSLSEFAGVELSPPDPFQGVSFAKAVREKKDHHRDFAVTGCHIDAKSYAGTGLLAPKCNTPFLTTKEWGYTPVGPMGERQLFDLRTDPLAEKNVIEDHRDKAEEFHSLLCEHLREYGADDAALAIWDNPTPITE